MEKEPPDSSPGEGEGTEKTIVSKWKEPSLYAGVRGEQWGMGMVTPQCGCKGGGGLVTR